MNDDRTESTAGHLLDYLASDGGESWVRFADLDDWQTLYNLRRESRFVGRMARNLADRGLAELRRSAEGMQLRLNDAGRTVAAEREAEAAIVLDRIDWSAFCELLQQFD